MNPPLSLIQCSDKEISDMLRGTADSQLQAALREVLRLRKEYFRVTKSQR